MNDTLVSFNQANDSNSQNQSQEQEQTTSQIQSQSQPHDHSKSTENREDEDSKDTVVIKMNSPQQDRKQGSTLIAKSLSNEKDVNILDRNVISSVISPKSQTRILSPKNHKNKNIYTQSFLINNSDSPLKVNKSMVGFES